MDDKSEWGVLGLTYGGCRVAVVGCVGERRGDKVVGGKYSGWVFVLSWRQKR